MLTIGQAIENYLRDLAVGQSPRTVETYSQGLERLREFLAHTNRSPTDLVKQLNVDDVLECARWLSEERGIAKATLRTYLATLSQFFNYLLREKLIDLPASEIERMRDALKKYRRGYHRPLPKLPPDEAITALLRAARAIKPDTKKPRLDLARLRNIAMLEALRASGMRVGELVSLKRDDLDYRNHTARVTGKANKQRIVYFDYPAWNAIQNYLKERADGAKGRALYQLPFFARHDRRANKRSADDDGQRALDVQRSRATSRDRNHADAAFTAARVRDQSARCNRRSRGRARYARTRIAGDDAHLCEGFFQAHEGRAPRRVWITRRGRGLIVQAR